MRKEASKDSEKVGSIPVNSELTVFDASGEYFEVEFDGVHGYALGKYLTEDPEEAKAAYEESVAQEKEEKKSSSGGSSSKKSSGKSTKKKSSDKKKKKDKECLTGGILN